MISNFEQMVEEAVRRGRVTVSVAVAQDQEVLEALKLAYDMKLVHAILVGDSVKIKEMAKQVGLPEDTRIIDESDDDEAALVAADLVRTGEAQVLMKGLINTSNFLRAALNAERGLRSGKILTHLMAFQIPGEKKIAFHVDGGMNIAPNLQEKKDILITAIEAVNKLGIKVPKIAALAANEQVNAKMPVTLDCKSLVDMWEQGEFPPCIIEGPIAMDVAINKEAAIHKGIDSQISGDVDIFLVPSIESGNFVGKILVHYAKAEVAGAIIGATHPIVMVSRADSIEAKVNSIALASLLS